MELVKETPIEAFSLFFHLYFHRMHRWIYILLFCSFWALADLAAQETSSTVQGDIIEVSGIVVTRNAANNIEFIPFITVVVEGTRRGTYASYDGMYSIVLRKGQSLRFSGIGYRDTLIGIPESIEGPYYSMIVELQSAPVELDEVSVFPWPDRDNFRAEFLAMNPGEALNMEALAERNLDRRAMAALADATKMDARENAVYLMRKQAKDYSYMGQVQPMRIFDPLAWGQFFRMWGDKKEKNRKARRQDDLPDDDWD